MEKRRVFLFKAAACLSIKTTQGPTASFKVRLMDYHLAFYVWASTHTKHSAHIWSNLHSESINSVQKRLIKYKCQLYFYGPHFWDKRIIIKFLSTYAILNCQLIHLNNINVQRWADKLSKFSL